MKAVTGLAGAALALSLCAGAWAAETPPLATTEADYTVENFKFRSGETLPELRLHTMTIGTPERDSRGRITNAVVLLHGTGGSGQGFLAPSFAGVLMAPGGLLDPAHTFIVLPDSIGHGKSSKPSDGLHAKFPHYNYDDMVAAQHAVLTKALGIEHVRLVLGTSMGCMHAFVWGVTYPGFMDALMPMACLPVEIAGRNRIARKITIDAIAKDPAWNGGEYKTQPIEAFRIVTYVSMITGSSPVLLMKSYGTRDLADKYVENRTPHSPADLAGGDANDMLYYVSASSDYDPSAKLGKIKANVLWVNSADDFTNPPELGIAEAKVKEIPHAKFVLIPAGPETRGHGTFMVASLWQQYLAELLKDSAR